MIYVCIASDGYRLKWEGCGLSEMEMVRWMYIECFGLRDWEGNEIGAKYIHCLLYLMVN